jgi:hypothetical protein
MKFLSKVMTFLKSDRFQFYLDEVARLEAIIAQRQAEQEAAKRERELQNKIAMLRRQAGIV